MGRIFDIALWAIIGAIIVTVLVTGGKTSVSLAKVGAGTWVRQLTLLTGQGIGTNFDPAS